MTIDTKCTTCSRAPGDRRDECEDCPAPAAVSSQFANHEHAAAPRVSEQDERALFEQDANNARFFPREIDFATTKSPSGHRDEYVNSHLQSRWEGWIARASLAHSAQAAPFALDDELAALEGLLAKGAQAAQGSGVLVPLEPTGEQVRAGSWSTEAGAGLSDGQVSEIYRAMVAAAAPVCQHSDDAAVDRFAAAMKAKMAASRAKGRNGWDDATLCPAERLRGMLIEHLTKGDPVDVGNFCMMLWNRGEPVAASPAPSAASSRSGPLDANELEQMAKAHPDECFLKGSGVLKLISAIRTLEQAAAEGTAPAQAAQGNIELPMPPIGRRVTYVPARAKKGVIECTVWGPMDMVLPPHRRIIADIALYEGASNA